MSCGYFQLSPTGRRGVGVLQARNGLDYPLVRFSETSVAEKILAKVVYPVKCMVVGGSFELKIQLFGEEGPVGPPFYVSDLLPTWPSTTPLEDTLPIFKHSYTAETTINYQDAVNAAIAHYSDVYPHGGIELNKASIEVALIDPNNLVVGWAAANSYQTTATVAKFPASFSENSFYARWQNTRQSRCANCPSNPVLPNLPMWTVVDENDLRYLIADFYLAYEDKTVNGQYQPPALPLRIKYLYNFGCVENTPPSGFPTPAGSLGITVVDANDSVVFDSIANTYTSLSWDWGDDYTVTEWRAPTATCRILVYKTWPETDDDKRNYAVYLAPLNAVLDSRTLYRIPNRVRSISVRDGASQLGPFRGDVVFRNSYNTEIAAGETTTTNFRVDTPITFSAVPGSGDGKYPCDAGFDVDDLKFITQINGVSGAKGDFILSGKDCLWLRRPTTYADDIATYSATADLQVGADCKPCCACEDYASTALYMNYVRDRYKLIGTRAEEVRSVHETNIARWNEYRLCSVQSPLRVIFVPQRCPYMDVVMLLCNPCESCMPSTTLTLGLDFEGAPAQDIEGKPLTVEIACGYTAMYATGINGLATSIDAPTDLSYEVTFPTLQPGDSAYIKFRLKFSIKAEYLVRGVLTGAYAVSGQPITIDCDGTSTTPASATTAQMLYCNNAGKTEMPC